MNLNFPSLKWGCFWHQFLRAKPTQLLGPNWTTRRVNLEITGATLEFKGAKTAFEITALSQMTPLKRANSAPMRGHFRSRGLFPLHTVK